jgi:hypothetical protein
LRILSAIRSGHFWLLEDRGFSGGCFVQLLNRFEKRGIGTWDASKRAIGDLATLSPNASKSIGIDRIAFRTCEHFLLRKENSMLVEHSSLFQRWWSQVGRRRSTRDCRPLAALGFLYRPQDVCQGLIDLRKLTTVVLHDEEIGRWSPALRLLGAGTDVVPYGVAWGGPGLARFYHDLRLEPKHGARGMRINATNTGLLELALRLHRQLHCVERYEPRAARSELKLPPLWAGFAPGDLEAITGDGPELATLCRKFDFSAQAMLEIFRRDHWGLACLPVDWVSGHLGKALRLFADLNEVPPVQIFQLEELPGQLVGYQGAVAYDFYHCREREHHPAPRLQCPAPPPRSALAA